MRRGRRVVLWTAAVLVLLVLPVLTVDAESSAASGPTATLAVTDGAPFEQVASLARVKGGALDSDPVSCGSPTDCWAFSGGLLRHTTDGGASWSDVSDLLPLSIELVDSIACPDPTICYVAARKSTRRATERGSGELAGIRVLTIRGDHVRQTRLTDDGVDPSIDCVSRTRCLLVDWKHSYVTADAGRTWTEARPAAIYGGTLSCAPGTTTCWNLSPGTVNGSGSARRTTNFGASWRPPTEIGQLQPDGISCPAATTCFAVGSHFDSGSTSTGVVATTTDGTTWTTTTVSGGATGLSSVACTSTLSCRIIGRGGPRTYAVTTDDGGATWRTRNLQVTRGFQVGIDCGDTQACVGVSSELSLRTIDGGRTWSAKDVPLEPDLLDAFTCATRSRCVGMYHDHNGDRYSITTTDGWRTWANHPLSRETGDISSIDCPTETVCFAWSPDGTDSGQSLVSHDGGTSWTVRQVTDTWRLSGARLSCPDANTCLAVGNLPEPVVLRTTNGGVNWQRLASPDTYVTDVACETVAFCVVLTSTTAYVTTDLGDQLAPYPLPAGRSYSRIDCTNRFCVAAGGRNRRSPSVIMSRDGGQTWLDAGTLGSLEDVADVDCGRGGACAVTARRSPTSGSARILATSDSGQSWELRHLHGTGSKIVDHLSCVGDTCFAADWGRLRSSRVLKGSI